MTDEQTFDGGGGNLLKNLGLTPSVVEKFWLQVNKTPGCWLWTGGRANGYGYFKTDKKLLRAHRISFILNFGPIPEGKELDHLCRVKKCVNPDHLEAVTHSENMSRHQKWKRESNA